MPKDFDIDFTALPPKLQMQLWVLALDANTSKVNLAYRLGGFRTNLTYNYGGNLEASLGVRRFMTKLSVDPATGSPTFGLAFRGFDFGASAGVSPKGVSLGLTATVANTGGTFSTGFSALPVVFARMPFGDFFGAVWYFMLFLAAITSSLSMLQPAKAFFEEALGLGHRAATALVAVLALGGNVFVLWFSKGLVALDTLDFWIGTFMIFVVAGTQIICFSWIFGVDKALAEADRGAQIRIPAVFRFIIKYVSPTYLLVIFIGFCWYNVPGYVRAVLGDPENGVPADSSAMLAWLVILSTIALLMIVTGIGARRWRALGLDIDGRRELTEPGSVDTRVSS
jgi:hypothetical protein